MPFSNRKEAGMELAAALAHYRGRNPVVLALPRGGVPVAAVVADVLRAPLDLIIARKIGAPMQPELAMGAVVDGETPIVVRNEDVIVAIGIGEEAFDAVCRKEIAETARRRTRYLGARPPVAIEGKTAIVIDDGIATGATVRAALGATRMRKPRTLVLATPVAPADTLRELRPEVDDLVCLESHEFFGSIGAYYGDFSQVSDEEVISLLAMSEAKNQEAGAR